MSTDPDPRFLENVLLQEYLRVCADVRSLEANGDRLLSIAVTTFAVAATVGVEKEVDLVFLALPAAIIGMLLYAIMIYVWIFSLCGYKYHLEDVINERCGTAILLWGVIVSKRESINLARRVLIGVYLIASAGMIVLSLTRVFRAYGIWPGVGVAGFCAVSFMLVILAWRQRGRIAKHMYKTAQSLYAARSIALSPKAGLGAQSP